MLALVVSNLLYPLVPVVVAAIVCVAMVLHQRRPKSVEANMRAFNKGLRALAPEPQRAGAASTRPAGSAAASPAVRPAPAVSSAPAGRHAGRAAGAEAETG